MRLTRRGNLVLGFAGLLGFLMLLGFCGWIEGGMQ